MSDEEMGMQLNEENGASYNELFKTMYNKRKLMNISIIFAVNISS